MELSSGVTGCRDSVSFSLCLFLGYGMSGSFLLQMSFLHVVLGGYAKSKSSSTPACNCAVPPRKALALQGQADQVRLRVT